MTKLKNLLSIEGLSKADIDRILRRTAELKSNRGKISAQPLAGQTWALIFSKPSTRTRVSFDVGIRELGGETIYLNAADAQLGRGELIKDTARVLARMIHGAVIRTYAQSDIEEFAEFSGVPTINALTDDEHPCQILGDIFTIIEKRGPPTLGSGAASKIDVDEGLKNLVVAYIGDGISNTARSWLFAASKLGFELRIASHKKYQPKKRLLERAGGSVTCTDDVATAAKNADVLYTDIWVSMGKESEEARREAELSPYWINDSVVKLANPDALVMHCLPAHRGQEIDEKTFESHAQTIFDQAENRLHVQKAILVELAS